MNGNERGSSRRSSRRRRRDNENWQGRKERKEDLRTGQFEKNRGGFHERPKWTAPGIPQEPIPVLDCPWCGKPIKDITAAIQDRASGQAVHFDCVIERIMEGEVLEPGDAVSYIGGGRFGVVHFNNPSDAKDFKIRKILEWEDKENRAEWRKIISDHFSMT
ncbi:MAG: hypothetical protein LBG42_07925 [Treponema sp.]|jgi:hypothetical protein|nr:hypothetical protein [Treponema sp.]